LRHPSLEFRSLQAAADAVRALSRFHEDSSLGLLLRACMQLALAADAPDADTACQEAATLAHFCRGALVRKSPSWESDAKAALAAAEEAILLAAQSVLRRWALV
jgi:hypothetical protein